MASLARRENGCIVKIGTNIVIAPADFNFEGHRQIRITSVVLPTPVSSSLGFELLSNTYLDSTDASNA